MFIRMETNVKRGWPHITGVQRPWTVSARGRRARDTALQRHVLRLGGRPARNSGWVGEILPKRGKKPWAIMKIHDLSLIFYKTLWIFMTSQSSRENSGTHLIHPPSSVRASPRALALRRFCEGASGSDHGRRELYRVLFVSG